jgi:predicted transcriptional regulator
MDTTLNVRIPAELKRQLETLSRRQHRAASDLVRESLRRYIATEQVAALRKMTVPLAEAQGFITDDDIFKAIS